MCRKAEKIYGAERVEDEWKYSKRNSPNRDKGSQIYFGASISPI